MSKIQERFSAAGRRLFDSEKPVVDAFNAKYGRALSVVAVSERRAERVSPQSAQSMRATAENVVSNTRFSERTRLLAASILTQTLSSSDVERLAGEVLRIDKDGREGQSFGTKARMVKRKNAPQLLTKKLSAPKSR
jgi:hypothetical protein